MSTGLSVERVGAGRPWTGFEAQWRALAEVQGNAFISPEWYRSWQEVYGQDSDPALLVVRDGDRIRGVVPLARTAGRVARWGFGGANLGDLFGPACAPGDEALVATAAAPAIVEAGAQLVVLDNVDALDAWGPQLGGRLAVYRYRATTLPRIDLGGQDWDGYLASRSRNLRSQIRRKTRSLERDHALELRLATPATLSADLETFFRLHEARWDPRGGSGSLTPHSRRFHAAFAARALEQGWLRLWTLALDGEPAASWYGWRVGDAYSYYLAGFEPRFAEQSVGFVLLAHTIRAAAEERCRTYELLLGEESYKARFATAERRVETQVLVGRRHPARALIAAETGLWRASRRLTPEARERARGAYRVLARRLPTNRRR